ncbi:hypothetical protein IPL68_02495 [Candidatus Saccharibacteria bacterium]|nr:MAG: hypothetical protein IPL68_02495 [Candidatus Saccharibacteria bacterium]
MLRAKRTSGKPFDFDREFAGGLLTPLTKEMYTAIISQTGNELLGVKSDKEFEQKLLRTPEYWIIGLSLSIAAYFLIFRQFDLPPLFAGVLGLVGSSFFTTKYLILKEELVHSGDTTWWVRLSDEVAKYLTIRLLYVLGLVCVIVSTFLPIFVAKGTTTAINLYNLAEVTRPAFSSVVLLPGFALLLILRDSRFFRIASAVLGIVSVIALFIVNSFSDTSDAVTTPEPQTTFSIATYLFTFGVATYLLARSVRKQNEQPNKPS